MPRKVKSTSLDRMYITGRRLDNAWPPAGDAGDQGVTKVKAVVKVTLQVKFKADHPGNWCERWYLTTIPRLGPTGHANIRVNFWGMALEIDHNYLARQRLDKTPGGSRLQEDRFTRH
nr:hypothetical protein BaRGS_004985 [Batillaria attramentaria]